MKKHVQYGCGLSAPIEWINFDTSPTLRIQKIPIIRFLMRNRLNATFPKTVKYGNIVKGLPISENFCEGIFCSHVLEHLSYQDFIIAIKNTYKILKPSGLFRLVMPDLNKLVMDYISQKESGQINASIILMRKSGLALEQRPKGAKQISESIFGNSRHQWLWDSEATVSELTKVGFKDIRKCNFNDSADPMFNLVENKERFSGSFALEMTK